MKDITEFLTEKLNENDANINENKITSKDDFREFAENMSKEAFGDDFDADKCNETIDKFLEDNKDLIDEDKWDEVVGKWKEGFTKKD